MPIRCVSFYKGPFHLHVPGGGGWQQWEQHSPWLRAAFGRGALTCPALSPLSCSGWSCQGSAGLSGCPARGAAAWHCYSLDAGQGMALLQNLLQKTPRHWEMPHHGWFLGGFVLWVILFVWLLLVVLFVCLVWVFLRFLPVGFEAETGIYCPSGVGKCTPWLWSSCLTLTAAELKSQQSTDLACSVIRAHIAKL